MTSGIEAGCDNDHKKECGRRVLKLAVGEIEKGCYIFCKMPQKNTSLRMRS